MIKTKSEELISKVNQNVFYKEFTFTKNDIHIDEKHLVELADNIIYINDFIINIEIKEKDESALGSNDNWFKNKVLGKAKRQIKRSYKYLNDKSLELPLGNDLDSTTVIKRENIRKIHNLIVYHSGELSLSFFCNNYQTQEGVFIHIISSEDYSHLCYYLRTPAEFESYLNFRENLLKTNKNTNQLPEQYILSHYLQCPNNLDINFQYIDALPQLCERIKSQIEKFDLHGLLSHLHSTQIQKNDDYLHILSQLAQLNRKELSLYKERLMSVIYDPIGKLPFILKRLAVNRINCAFVLMAIDDVLYESTWYNALVNLTREFKYKTRMQKCVGLIVRHINDYIELNWCYIDEEWHFDPILQQLVDQELEFSRPGLIPGGVDYFL